MEDIGEDWEMVEHSSCNHSAESKMAWFLDNGFSIGKKIVITGALISSTPFLLPPLVLISALGFALSVPSAILLSSYACTKKIMSKLLPRPDHPLMLEYETRKEDRVSDKIFVEKKDESGYEEDVGEYLDIEGNGDKPAIEKGTEEQPIGHVSVAKDDIHTENKGDKERVSAKNSDEKDIGVTVVEEKTMTTGNEKKKKSDKKKRGNKKENTSTEQEELGQEIEKGKILHQTNAGTREIGDKSPEGTAELHSSEAVPESKQTTAYPTGKGLELSEGSIKKKIEALRVIVGYRAVPHKTCIGELRDLYMFTGVEPPTPFKQPSDLSDVIDKLEFLMSNVGVK